jgi:Zn-finger nucleic acid-binding protein
LNTPVDLSWITETASQVTQARGRALFRLRSLALRWPSLFGFAGIVVAYLVPNRWVAHGILLVAVLPAVCLAPGLQAATLAAARGKDVDARVFLLHLHRAPAYALLAVARWLAVAGATTLIFPVGWWLDLRLSLVGFVMMDGEESVLRCLRTGFRLTAGTALRQLWLEVVEGFDASLRYGVRASLDGRVRRAIGQALLFDYLVKREFGEPAHQSSPAAPAGAAAVSPTSASAPSEPAPAEVTHDGASAVAAPAGPPRVIDPSRPTCPRCAGALERVELTDLVLGRCPQCAGVWLDNGFSSRLAGGQLSPSALVVSRQAPVVAAPPPSGPLLQCPLCGVAMRRSLVLAARLEVDACAAHGTWFDRGELERAYLAFEQSRRDREEIARLMASSGADRAAIYGRGPGAIVRATGQALKGAAGAALGSAKAAADATIDSAIEGREEDREEMLLDAVGAALAILTGRKDADDD